MKKLLFLIFAAASLSTAQAGYVTPTPTPKVTPTPTATPTPSPTATPTPPQIVFNVRLDGEQEVPPNVTNATGKGTVTLKSGGGELEFQINYSGLTGPVTGMHIHGPGIVGQDADILYDLIATGNGTGGGTSGLIQGSMQLTDPTQSGVAKSLSTQRDELNNNKWYINIHNAAFPGGEIRGQLLHQDLLNISTRARVQTGDNVLIGGFILSGNEAKKVIIRAIGPSLGGFSIQGALQDPTLELHGKNGVLIASNDNWKQTQQAAIQATGIPPSDDRESAIIATLVAQSSGYTAIVRGKNSTTGVALVEVYDLDPAADSKLANISTRARVETGDNVMIGGFIVGPGATEVLVRGIGPSLTNAGVPGALQDPTLELHNQQGALIGANDNWKTTQQAAIQATGIPPTDDRESAILAILSPGGNTAILRGKNSTTGVGLVEVYAIK
jgi:hypothetical protein